MALTRSDRDQEFSQFPIRLLFAGYATGGAAALAVAMQGGGWLAAVLTFWLGGAAATVLWGAAAISFCPHERAIDTSEAECLRRGAVTAPAE